MFLGRGVSLLLGVTASIAFARSLGATDFGLLSYTLALASILCTLQHLGLSSLVVKKLVLDRSNQALILSTAFVLKAAVALSSFTILLLFLGFTEQTSEAKFVLLLVGLTIFAPPFEVIDLWFQSMVKARVTALATLFSSALGNLLKLLAAAAGLSVTFAALTHALMVLIHTLTISRSFVLHNKESVKFKYSPALAKELLRDGLWVFIGSASAVIYLKVDIIMLQYMLDQKAVGHYAAAVTLSEVWYVIPSILMAAVFPKLIELKAETAGLYTSFLQRALNSLFVLSVLICIFILYFSDQIVSLFYGHDYSPAGNILKIHILAASFIFLRAVVSKWIVAEEIYFFSALSQTFGAAVNVAMNLLLIPAYGVEGAAWATLISYATAGYLSFAISSKTRPMFLMMTRAITLRWLFVALFDRKNLHNDL